MMNVDLLVLDTHIWIWAVNKELDKLSNSAIQAINEAEKQRKLAVSAISVWEVSMLEAKGRIALTPDCLTWVNEVLSFPHLTLIPLTPEIAVFSSRLPGEIHGDPADRIIAATCLTLSARLLTKDQKLLAYSENSPLQVITG
ncbi:MAG: type II toxin-antitoxin system VapC family toxin [Synechocystis sp.]|nr:type II toxin-antitoxin system VapC family toxin [Synechocystis sp.]